MSQVSIVKIDRTNYMMFDDMVFYRMNGREKTETERQNTTADFSDVYTALSNPNLFVYAALTDEKFVGWVSIVYIPKVGRTNGYGHMYIDELWVNESYRNLGIAGKLMEMADRLSAKTRSLGVRLYVNTDNVSARNLYKKCGYSEMGEAYFMEKEIKTVTE